MRAATRRGVAALPRERGALEMPRPAGEGAWVRDYAAPFKIPTSSNFSQKWGTRFSNEFFWGRSSLRLSELR